VRRRVFQHSGISLQCSIDGFAKKIYDLQVHCVYFFVRYGNARDIRFSPQREQNCPTTHHHDSLTRCRMSCTMPEQGGDILMDRN
jgi:hypothetical protein